MRGTSEGKYEAPYFSMEMHRQSRELAHQKMQEMNDELSKKDGEIERLRELLKECRDYYVELGMSSVDSELCDRIERELDDE